MFLICLKIIMLQCWNRNILFNLYGYLKSDGNEYKLDISSSYGNKLNLIDKLRLLLLVKRNELIELFPLLILCCNKKINHILVEVKLSIKHYEQQKLYKYTKVSKPRIKDLHKKHNNDHFVATFAKNFEIFNKIIYTSTSSRISWE